MKVQADLPDAQLALIGCGVTTGVGAVLNTAAMCPGSSVAVLGCGGVGQSVVQGARIAGATRTIVMVAIRPTAAFSWTPFGAVRNEKRVLGCWCGSTEVRRDFPRLIERGGVIRSAIVN